MIILSNPAEAIGREVMHQGARIGLVTEVKPNMENGRLYAFIQPHDVTADERRIPLDELDLVRGV